MQIDRPRGLRPSASTIDRWLMPLAAVAMVTVLLAPRTTHAVHVVLAAFPLLALWSSGGLARLQPWPAVALAMAGFGGYLLLNAGWSADPLEAYGKVAYYWWLVATAFLAIVGLKATDGERLSGLLRGALLGIAVGAAALAIESAFHQPFRRLVYNLLPFIRSPAKHLSVSGDTVTKIGLYTLNRNLGILCLVLWPALLLIRTQLAPGRWRIAAVALAAVTAIAAFTSEHETSMLALVFSGVAFLGLLLAPKLMRWLILAGWLVATLLVVPLAVASYRAELHKSTAIPVTGRNRIILWGFTANEIRKAPILGIGVGSTKELDEQAGPSAARPADYTYPLRTGRHSHNIFMQTWYELGAIGALLFAGVGVLGWLLLSRLPPLIQPYALASFVSAVLIGAFSWGLWQTWFMAAYAIWALLLAMAVHLAERADGAGEAAAVRAATATPR